MSDRWKVWTEYAQQAAAVADPDKQPSSPMKSPPKIDNSSLLIRGGDGRLIPELTHGDDYELITTRAWNALHWWHGGGPEIKREIVTNVSGQLELELYPLVVTIFRSSAMGSVIGHGTPMHVSGQADFKTMLERACGLVGLSYELQRGSVQMWALNAEDRAERQLLSLDDDENANVHELGVEDGKHLLLEVQHASGRWPSDNWKQPSVSPRVSAASSGSDSTSTRPSGELKQAAGVTGLQNLGKCACTKCRMCHLCYAGNTCYMNSALQCLSHTRLLREYFLNHDFEYDVNLTAKYGMAGHLAVSFFDLLQDLWASRNNRVCAPRGFKDTLGQFNQMFEGSQQQDAQEMLGIFLEGLSEDLNRIKEKPFVELPDSKGRPDAVVAAEWWAASMKRDLSVVTLLFTGQFKSVVHCKTCHFESVSQAYEFRAANRMDAVCRLDLNLFRRCKLNCRHRRQYLLILSLFLVIVRKFHLRCRWK